MLLLTAAGLLLDQNEKPAVPPARPRSLAVLPLINLSNDPGQDYFADGLTRELTATLGQVNSLRVISAASAMTYKGTTKALAEIARELNVNFIVEGSSEHRGNRIRVTTLLLDAKSYRTIWAHSYDHDGKSELDWEGEVALAVADQLHARLIPQQRTYLRRARQANPAAVDLYFKGVQLAADGDHKGSITFYRQALTLDETDAQAHTALASAYGCLGRIGAMPAAQAFAQQRSEALKAIDLNDWLPEAHVQLGLGVINQSWDFTAGEKELKRALKLNPNSSAAHWAYSSCLLRLGQINKSLAEAGLAVQTDPVSSDSHAQLAVALYFARQYGKALAQAEKVPAARARAYLSGIIQTEQGQYAAAISHFQELGDSPNVCGHRGNALARSGHRAEALAEILSLKKQMARRGFGRFEIALIYTGLKQNDNAFDWLEQAMQARDQAMIDLLIDPLLDPLRSDPRFQSLCQRMGFPAL